MTSTLRLALLAGVIVLALPLGASALRAIPQPPAQLSERISERALRRGDSGEAVAELQRVLQGAGFDPGPADGRFGPRTEAAVRKAQAQSGLEADGLFGRLTMDALTEAATPAVATPAVAAVEPDTEPDTQALVIHATDVIPVDARPRPRKAPGAAGHFALTFNGAPDPVLLPKVLEALERFDMKATFFIPGEAAVRRPELVARIVAAGHEVGSAGYQAIDMTRLTPAMIQAQLKQATSAILAAAGQSPRYFRPPLGHSSFSLRTAASAAGMETALWTNVAIGDPRDATAEELAARLPDTVYPGAVVMLHQDREATVEALEPLLANLARQGFQSLTLSQLAEQELVGRPI